jgi:small-conductance mechanosensitive channel
VHIRRLFASFALICLACGICIQVAVAQTEQAELQSTASNISDESGTPSIVQKVDVAPSAADSEIATRLQRILKATEWFDAPEVRVDEGVVFLHGTAKSEEVKEWAGNLARRTEGVVAVVNQLELERPPLLDLDPAWEGLRKLWHDSIGMLPFVLFAFVILVLAWFAARLAALGVHSSLQRQLNSALLLNVLARAVAFLVFVMGIYIVLRVSGLTRLALTVIGGTGILGLVIGIAFRDITENFLASIFLSMRRPFLVGDLVEIVNVLGYVQRLTTRTTVLITLNGNHVEIPNSIVYKNTIRNFTTNKNRREDFTVGIGYDVRITEAQDVALRVLREHPAVLKDPEPWTLVDGLGSAVVVLRIYFWLDGSKHSWLKVKSSVIRLVKRAFQDAGISMPDEAREVVFPKGVPVQMLQDGRAGDRPDGQRRISGIRKTSETEPSEPTSTNAEGGLESEADEIENQARQSRLMEGDNLLERIGDGHDKADETVK